jgi:hypothetical protein
VVLEDPGDRARRQTDAELDQLSLDAAIAPPGILLRQTDNEHRGFLVDRWPPGTAVPIGPAPSD